MMLIIGRKIKTMMMRPIVWALSASCSHPNQSGKCYEKRHNRISSWKSYPISRDNGLGVVQLKKLRKEWR